MVASALRVGVSAAAIAGAVLLSGCAASTAGIAVPAANLGHAPAPVSVTALEGLLLPPEQLSSLLKFLKTAGLVVKEWNSTGYGGQTTSNDCAATWTVTWRPTYVGSGWTAIRGQYLTDGDNATHKVWQAVVSFPLPVDAAAFYRKQVAAWRTCDGRRLEERTLNEPAAPDNFWRLGQATDQDGILTMVGVQEADSTGWGCGRALTVRNNVAVDTQVCAAPPGDQAESVAKAIAQKVPVS